MSELGFDGQVAVVTGAGGGLGREHAMLLASRGARVVVNDLGGAVDGTGGDGGPAQRVADEINAAGGEAIANGDSVGTPEGGDYEIDWDRKAVAIGTPGYVPTMRAAFRDGIGCVIMAPDQSFEDIDDLPNAHQRELWLFHRNTYYRCLAWQSNRDTGRRKV